MAHRHQSALKGRVPVQTAKLRRHRPERAAKFAAAKALGLSQKEAAKAAGYRDGAAARAAMGLAQRGDVVDAAATAVLDASLQTSFTIRELVEAVAEIAFMDPATFFTDQLQLRPGVYQCTLQHIRELPLRARRCISSLRVVRRNLTAGDGVTDEVVEVRFWNKLEAMRLLMEHKGLLVHKVEVDLTVMTKKVAQMDDDTLADRMAVIAAQMAEDARERAQLRLSAKVLDTLPLPDDDA
jgi:hypothetical protein